MITLAISQWVDSAGARRLRAGLSWVYVTQNPLISFFVPYWLADTGWPPLLKFALALGVGTPLLFLSYHYCVRSTFVGVFLNGGKSGLKLRECSPSTS